MPDIRMTDVQIEIMLDRSRGKNGTCQIATAPAELTDPAERPLLPDCVAIGEYRGAMAEVERQRDRIAELEASLQVTEPRSVTDNQEGC